MMMADVIVFGSAGLAAAFVLVWLLRPDLRAWMEQPKHRFQDAARRYDESRVRTPPGSRPR
jgi:hypothetical protein